MNTYPMTIHGADALRDELNHLKSVRRPEIVAAIRAGRELPDRTIGITIDDGYRSVQTG